MISRNDEPQWGKYELNWKFPNTNKKGAFWAS